MPQGQISVTLSFDLRWMGLYGHWTIKPQVAFGNAQLGIIVVVVPPPPRPNIVLMLAPAPRPYLPHLHVLVTKTKTEEIGERKKRHGKEMVRKGKNKSVCRSQKNVQPFEA